MTTLVAGEALIDIVERPDGAISEHVGGSPLNVAIGLSRLGHPTVLATHIGRDPHGEAIIEHLAADDVALVEGSMSADRTPTARAVLDESGAATYEFDITWQMPARLPDSFAHLHSGSIGAVLQPGASAVEAAFRAARSHATVSLDPNARPSLMGNPADVRAHVEQLIGLSDVVKASDEDIAWLYGDDTPLEDILRLWARLGPAITVATRGGAGAVVWHDRSATLYAVAGLPVSVADTVGAGDSFMSGLLSGLLDAGLLGGADARARLHAESWDVIRAAVDRAVRASSITVSRAGAQPPTLAEL